MIFSIETKLDKASNLFWFLYLFIFMFLPIIFMILIEYFQKKFSIVKSEKMRKFNVDLNNAINNKEYPLDSVSNFFSDNSTDKFEAYSGIVNRMLVIYYIGIVGIMTFLWIG